MSTQIMSYRVVKTILPSLPQAVKMFNKHYTNIAVTDRFLHAEHCRVSWRALVGW